MSRVPPADPSEPNAPPVGEAADLDTEALAERFRDVFPHMGAGTYPLVLALYRLLARGRPVRWDTLAGVALAAGAPPPLEAEDAKALVTQWPGLYETPAGITGFGGLSIRPVSEHRMSAGSQLLHTRCAWDTLFIPELLRKPVTVQSRCGLTGTPIHFRVDADGPNRVQPAGTVLSLPIPRPEMAADLTALF